MEIVCGITHLIMAICLTIILYLSLKPYETSDDQKKLPEIARFYIRGVKIIEVTAFAVCRIAANILLVYLK
jgi:hypothetical protein